MGLGDIKILFIALALALYVILCQYQSILKAFSVFLVLKFWNENLNGATLHADVKCETILNLMVLVDDGGACRGCWWDKAS